MATEFSAQITFCYTADLQRTAAFYEGALGLALALDQGTCRIYRTAPGAYIGFCSRASAPRPDGIILTLVTDDVDGWFLRVKSSGANVIKEPAPNPQFQIYNCFVNDPNGYLIEIQKFTDPRWESPGDPPQDSAIAAILHAARAAGQLKRLKRAGWVERQVPQVESVAEHSFRSAVLAVLAGGKLRRERLVTIALLHDLCEAITGDATPADGLDPAVKSQREEQAMAALTTGLVNGQELYELWLDFERGRTPEGRLIKQIDKLEMALQALEYAESGHPGLQEFLADGRRVIEDPLLRELFQRIERSFPATD